MKKLLWIIFVIPTVFCFGQKEITLEGIWQNYTFYANSVPGFNFMKDGKHYSRLESNVIKSYDLTTGNFKENILDGANLEDQSGFGGKISSYTFSEDESRILIKSESEAIYRRSSKAYFHVYDRKTNKLTSVYNDDKISHASFSPDGKMVAYVWQNNLYYFDIANEITLPITFDGEKNKIINGMCDWVYEEEFAFTKAFEWSPDGKRIAYIRFDESEVKEFTMTWYNDDMYPEYDTFKYPKVGEANAKVSVVIYDLKSEKSVDANVGDLTDMYIPRIKWTNSANRLCVFKMNRHQNNLQLYQVDASTGLSKLMLEENNKYFIDVTDDLRFLENGKEFIWSSEADGYNHIYLYNMSGQLQKQLTKGNYDVTAFYGVDEKNKKIYYQAAKNSPMERQIYSTSLNGNDQSIVAVQSGTNRAQFSSTFDYYVNTHSTINEPATYTVYDRNNKKIRVIEDNSDLKYKQKEYGVNEIEFMTIPASEGVDLNAYILKPNDFKENRKYPVFVTIYGGPNSQTVTDSWKGNNYWWYQMLADEGYIVVSIDNRGTGARGEEFRKMTYQELGKYETIDQINAAKYLAGLDYVDGSRIGIFGWSYGGFMSSNCILKGSDVFKAAIAVAPVTNWKWYDTIYTERYMRTEKENPTGYHDNSPIYFADQLKGAYLLVHGVADDNVHFQHTAEMARALIKANKQFDTYFYPNRNHGIYGDNARIHLYTKMSNFIFQNL